MGGLKSAERCGASASSNQSKHKTLGQLPENVRLSTGLGSANAEPSLERTPTESTSSRTVYGNQSQFRQDHFPEAACWLALVLPGSAEELLQFRTGLQHY